MEKNQTEIFFREWNAHGGLLTQAETGRILKCSSAYIDQLCKEKKLNKYKVNDKKYLSCTEVYQYWLKKKEK